MRLSLISDIHSEFHKDGGESLVRSFNPGLFDVLVLAGDIGVVEGCSLSIFLEKAARQVGGKPIVYVPGNHEYYGSDFLNVQNIRKTLPSCVHFLDNETTTIDGQRFVGSTLWFPYQSDSWQYDSFLGDFKYIEGFRDWNYDRANFSREFLNSEIREGDITVTHHLPDENAIAPRYRVHPFVKYNRYFFHQMPMETLSRPKYWLFGHTHEPCDYNIGNCRLVCNPFGYPGETKTAHVDNLILVS
jgi:predicted phosphodiesterase